MNMLAIAAESLVERARQSQQPLPAAELEAFITTTSHSAHARRLAFEILAATDASIADRLIPAMLTDPGAEFRRDAVNRLLVQAGAEVKQGQPEAAKQTYQQALKGAVHEDQVEKIVEGLKPLDVDVDFRQHFGFLTNWNVIGPFDNRDGIGFAAIYPPEQHLGQPLDPTATYPGQQGEVAWKPLITDDRNGVVDIGKRLENYKGSAMYLATEFDSPTARQVEFRLGTPNAWKLWVNGEPVFQREEYHRGSALDQYRVPVDLKAGKNQILFKILQNEQTQEWAQAYEFRFRVTDSAGSAIRSANATKPSSTSGS